MTIADHPLHRSGGAALPHPALASGGDGKAHAWIGMTDPRRRKPAGGVGAHAAPRQMVALTPTAQDAPPELDHRFPKRAQRRTVHRDTAIPVVFLHGVATPKWPRLAPWVIHFAAQSWPARPPVNASPPPTRATAHDSGPVRVATPLPYDFFIHYISPVRPAHGGHIHTLSQISSREGDGLGVDRKVPAGWLRLVIS